MAFLLIIRPEKLVKVAEHQEKSFYEKFLEASRFPQGSLRGFFALDSIWYSTSKEWTGSLPGFFKYTHFKESRFGAFFDRVETLK